MRKEKPQSDMHLVECRCPWCTRQESPTAAYLQDGQGEALAPGVVQSVSPTPERARTKGGAGVLA